MTLSLLSQVDHSWTWHLCECVWLHWCLFFFTSKQASGHLRFCFISSDNNNAIECLNVWLYKNKKSFHWYAHAQVTQRGREQSVVEGWKVHMFAYNSSEDDARSVHHQSSMSDPDINWWWRWFLTDSGDVSTSCDTDAANHVTVAAAQDTAESHLCS